MRARCVAAAQLYDGEAGARGAGPDLVDDFDQNLSHQSKARPYFLSRADILSSKAVLARHLGRIVAADD